MKLPIVLLLSLAILPPLAAPAAASHHGPCTHEYVDAAQSGDVREIRRTVDSCVDRLLAPLCRILDPCILP